MEEKKKKNIFSKLFKNKDETKKNKFKLVSAFVLFGIIILIFLSSLPISSKKKTENKETQNYQFNFSSMEYCRQIENRLKSVIQNIKGIGDASVFVMVDSSPEIKYLSEGNVSQNQNGETISSQTTIYESRNGSIYAPVVQLEILPKITGVLIVATGAKDIKLKVTLTNMVSNVLGVSVSCVEVLEGR